METSPPMLRTAVRAVLRSRRFSEFVEDAVSSLRASFRARFLCYAISSVFLAYSWSLIDVHHRLEGIQFLGVFVPAYSFLVLLVLVSSIVPAVLAASFEIKSARCTLSVLGALPKFCACLADANERTFPDAAAAVDHLSGAIRRATKQVVIVSPNLIYFKAQLWERKLGTSTPPQFRRVMEELSLKGSLAMAQALEACSAEVVFLVPDPRCASAKAMYERRADLCGMSADDLRAAHKEACDWARGVSRTRSGAGLTTRIEFLATFPSQRFLQADEFFAIQDYPEGRPSLTEPVRTYAVANEMLVAALSHSLASLRKISRIGRGSTRHSSNAA